MTKVHRIGIIGTGFVARGLIRFSKNFQNLHLSHVLTRRNIREVSTIPECYLTNSLQELIDNSDLVVEVSGDAVYSTDVICNIIEAGKPIVTMNSEFHVTTGSFFVDKGYISEAEGDQPGCLAKLKEEAEFMGFNPLAYVNIKGFLNLNPTHGEMSYWSDREQIRFEQAISFTDGTKLQIEQALVANGLGGTIVQEGLMGCVIENIKDTEYLASKAKEISCPISDYIVSPSSPPGVFIVAENEEAAFLENYGPFAKLKTSQGNYFVLLKPHHLIHLEMFKTINRALQSEPPLLNNSSMPRVSVCAIAKVKMKRGDTITRGAGSFKVRGSAVLIKNNIHHVPICLLANARVLRNIEPGQQITFDDVELPQSMALEVYLKIRENVLGNCFGEVRTSSH